MNHTSHEAPRRRGAVAILLGALLASFILAGPPRPADAQDATQADFRKIVQDAKNKVFPAVVYIKCVTESLEAGKKISQETAGSGVVISPEGEVLTNHHVVDKAVEVRCLLSDGRAFKAKVLGKDKDTDLAMLKLEIPEDDRKPVPYATLGDSAVLKEGDFVMAMGAPWGLARSVSIGIISCTERFLEGHSEYSLWLQTDAAISPGNSGGPLVNTDGEVVGINALGVMYGGDMGFAIPSSTLKIIIAQIRQHGKVDWSWTGLRLQPLRDFNRNIYFKETEGVIVAGTDPESPARRAGLLPRDRIVSINGRSVTGLTEENLPPLRQLLGLLPKGTPVKIVAVRGEEKMDFDLTPREKGRVEGEELDCPRWDLTVKSINQFDNPQLYFHRKEGVFIYGIRYPGNAAASGLAQNDIVLKIDGKDVATLDDVKAIHKETVANVEKKHRILFTVLRNGMMKQFVVDFQRDYEKE